MVSRRRFQRRQFWGETPRAPATHNDLTEEFMWINRNVVSTLAVLLSAMNLPAQDRANGSGGHEPVTGSMLDTRSPSREAFPLLAAVPHMRGTTAKARLAKE